MTQQLFLKSFLIKKTGIRLAKSNLGHEMTKRIFTNIGFTNINNISRNLLQKLMP